MTPDNKHSPSLMVNEGQLVRPSPAGCALSVRALTVSYGVKPAVFSVDADLPERCMSAIIGPNGAGKSTFLKAALGIITKTCGDIRFFGQNLDKVRSKIAYVPQRASVDWEFPARVIDVVMMGMYRQIGPIRLAGRRQREKAMACLERVQMTALADRQIGKLSGGQQQRVFLARALAQQAECYLLDEPFAGVDAATERAIVAVLKSLRDQGHCIVCVHHDLATVKDYFDHVLMINVSKVAEGPIDTTFTEKNLQTTYGVRLINNQFSPAAGGQESTTQANGPVYGVTA